MMMMRAGLGAYRRVHNSNSVRGGAIVERFNNGSKLQAVREAPKLPPPTRSYGSRITILSSHPSSFGLSSPPLLPPHTSHHFSLCHPPLTPPSPLAEAQTRTSTSTLTRAPIRILTLALTRKRIQILVRYYSSWRARRTSVPHC